MAQKTGTIILVLTTDRDGFSRLHTTTAIMVDDAGLIRIDPPILDGNGERLDAVLPSACFAYDLDLADAVNGLMTSSRERLTAARELLAIELEPAELNVGDGGVPKGPTFH